jgi:flagellar biosynthetic protein FliS
VGVEERYAAKLYEQVSRVVSSPFERIETMFSGALRLTRQGRTAAVRGEADVARQRADKVSAILKRLDVCLDHGLAPELSANLSRLYGHMQGRLATPEAALDPDVFDEVLGLLGTLWEGFQEADRQPGE